MEPLLRDVTFVVVDVETTGGAARQDAMTEIGAVKVRGGEQVGEFATLINPGRPIPPFIRRLTGITDAMVATAPPITAVMPGFLEFIRGTVLVAHNARFDMGFLRAAAEQCGHVWPALPVLDTVRLARAVFSKVEMPSVKLALLAAACGTSVAPDHRALHDAQATADVLHHLIDRLGSLQITTLSDLVAAQRGVDPARRRKAHLARHIPHEPGVYLFKDEHEAVLYVGTSRDLRTRVQSYFNASEKRQRIKHMVTSAARIDIVTCAVPLEAQVREQRLIAAHKPPFNRVSKNPERLYWVHPAKTVPYSWRVATSSVLHEAGGLGPFPARRLAAAVGEAAKLAKLEPETVRTGAAAVLTRLHDLMGTAAAHGSYQQAAELRDVLATAGTALVGWERRQHLCRIEELVAAQPDGDGGWHLVVVRHGRMVAAGRAERGIDPLLIVEMLRATSEHTVVDPSTGLAASPQETSTILSFLEQSDVRLVDISEPWAVPADGACRWSPFIAQVASAHSAQRDPREL